MIEDSVGEGAQRLKGEVALVTGAGSGIGREIALRLGRDGAAVAVIDVNEQGAAETTELIVRNGGRALPLVADVADRASVRACVSKVEQQLGPLTIAVNNAGISPSAPFLELTDETWSRTLAVNLTGPFIVSQEVGRLMASRGYGRILNVASISAHVAHEGLAAYSASKAGLEALTRSMAFELGPAGVNVNAIEPAAVLTPLMEAVIDEAGKQERLRRLSVPRLGHPREIAAAVAFLVSREASFIQGAVLATDGGFLISGIRGTKMSQS